MNAFAKIRNIFFIAFPLLLLAAGVFVVTTSPRVAAAETKSKLPIAEERGGEFTLTGHDGGDAKVSLQDYRGKIVLLTFGYTHCPDVCPLILTHLKQLMQKLGPHQDDVQTLFVTLDPERDTPDRLKTYVSYFNPAFMGLTGSQEDILQVTKQYGAVYMKLNGDSAAGYLYAHTDYIYLIDHQGRLRMRYRSEAPLERIASDIQLLLASNSSPIVKKGKP